MKGWAWKKKKKKNRNGKDLTEVKEIKKRWGKKNTQKNYTKGLNDPDNHDGVITHLELYILESDVK